MFYDKKFTISKDWSLFPFRLIFFVSLYFLVNFDESQKLDYQTYESNYLLEWSQFEIGFELLMHFFRHFQLEFSTVWMLIIIFEIFLISRLYEDKIVFLFGIPNLIFLSQGLLGTQVRFGLAVLLSLYIFKRIEHKNIFNNIFMLVPGAFHLAALLLVSLAFYSRHVIDAQKSIAAKSNAAVIFLLILSLLSASYMASEILLAMDYAYYVGTKYDQGKSLPSIVYILLSFFFCTLLLIRKGRGAKDQWVLLGSIVALFSIIFAQSSVISGRFLMVYVLIEPFILAYAYKNFGSKIKYFPFFVLISSVLLLKTLTVSLVW